MENLPDIRVGIVRVSNGYVLEIQPQNQPLSVLVVEAGDSNEEAVEKTVKSLRSALLFIPMVPEKKPIPPMPAGMPAGTRVVPNAVDQTKIPAADAPGTNIPLTPPVTDIPPAEENPDGGSETGSEEVATAPGTEEPASAAPDTPAAGDSDEKKPESE